MTSRSDPEDVRLRFGMDPPRLEEREYWESMHAAANEYPTLSRRASGSRETSATPGTRSNGVGIPARLLNAGEPLTVDEDGEA